MYEKDYVKDVKHKVDEFADAQVISLRSMIKKQSELLKNMPEGDIKKKSQEKLKSMREVLSRMLKH